MSRSAAALGVVLLAAGLAAAGEEERRLPVREYRDKMKAGWIGQIIGVSWGGPTEGQYKTIIPEEKVPRFREGLVNEAFNQDDLYVEMTFLRSMEQYGFDVTIRQAGIDFANSGYALAVANDAGRRNLRNGIAPPDSSHPKFHGCAGAIDYQIEADYSGLIAPGMPDVVVALGEKFGRLMNYGDGVYAGQFTGVLYAEAFFEKDVLKLIDAGLRSIPKESRYAEMVRDMLRWRRENPDDWAKTWALAVEKYDKNQDYNICELDVKREGAMVLLGLLYGGGDLDKTMIISCRGGFDSDCNPSSSGGVLFTTRGLADIPDRYYKKLNEKKVFSHTAYNFPALMDVCEKLARQAVAKHGGRVEKDAAGEEVFVIPVKPVTPSRFEDLKDPGPAAGSLYTDAEMAQVRNPGLGWALPYRFPGWEPARATGFFWWEKDGRREVLELQMPEKGEEGWVLSRKLEVPAGKKTRLSLAAGIGRVRGWDLVVRADGRELLKKAVDRDALKDGWVEAEVDLSALAGKTAAVEVGGVPKASRKNVVSRVAGLSVTSE